MRRNGVLVLDNNGFDEAQLRAIQDLLAVIPPVLHRTTHVSQHTLLGNQRERKVALRLRGSPGVNVFPMPVAGPKRNQFPPDVAPVTIPRFCATLQHEINHIVDGTAVRGSAELARRRDQLVAQAGVLPANFLRSRQPRGFFARLPREFFASIANQWFASSPRTLELARTRLASGRLEPANQFLFFAEVYSQGGDRTLFVEQDAQCRYTATWVPVGRNENGHIDRLSWQGREYRFELDPEGNVKRGGSSE